MGTTYFISILLLFSCRPKEPANVSSPGEEKTSKTKVLEVGAAALQNKTIDHKVKY